MTVGMVICSKLSIVVPVSVVSRQTRKETTARCEPFFSRSCSMTRTFTSGWNRLRPCRQSMPATNLIHLFIPQAVTDYLHYARHFEMNRVDPMGAWSLHKERRGNDELLFQRG